MSSSVFVCGRIDFIHPHIDEQPFSDGEKIFAHPEK